MFIAAILIIAQIWKQPKDAAVDEQISKMRTVCTLEHYLGTKIEWGERGGLRRTRRYIPCSQCKCDDPQIWHKCQAGVAGPLVPVLPPVAETESLGQAA